MLYNRPIKLSPNLALKRNGQLKKRKKRNNTFPNFLCHLKTHLFLLNLFSPPFSSLFIFVSTHLHSPFEWIWAKDKSSGFYFTNILWAAFSYESFVWSFFVLEVNVKLFIGAKKMAQMRSKNVDEIDSSSKFHQHYTRSFCTSIFAPKKYKPKSKYKKVLRQTFVRKRHSKNVDEIDFSSIYFNKWWKW